MKNLKLILKLILTLAIVLIGYASFFYATQRSQQKLTVEQMLQEHLATRFDDVSKDPQATPILMRDRVIIPQDVKRFAMPYIDFAMLNNDEISINSDLSNTIIYTNFHTKYACKDIAPHKVAWLIESPKKTAGCFKFLQNKNNEAQFKKILTCYRPLLEKGHPYVFAPVEGTHVDPNNVDLDETIKNKQQTLSIIASNKNWCPGHKLRHKAVERFKDKIDAVLGRGYHPIKTTMDGLLGFRYSIVIENRQHDFYFSEKLIDCLLCGTIPIYWGCPSIGKFFNTAGFLQFNTLDELESILNNLSVEDYNSRLEIIKENFNIARCYVRTDKYLRKELEKLGLIQTVEKD